MLYTLHTARGSHVIDHPVVMGILNCTPDSFYAGSRTEGEAEIARRADEIISEGGTIIDVGGMSTRPGGVDVSEAEEMTRLRRALAVVRRRHPDVLLSVDTFRPAVARMAVEEFGADIINDVSEGGVTSLEGVESLEGAGMCAEVARLGVPYVLMSVQPTLAATLSVFEKKVGRLRELGVRDIILDPGYGFGKTVEANYDILGGQPVIRSLFPDLPLLAGVSRKRMIWQLLGTSPDEALNGTTVVNTLAVMNGAAILRVHDVREAVETVKICGCVR